MTCSDSTALTYIIVKAIAKFNSMLAAASPVAGLRCLACSILRAGCFELILLKNLLKLKLKAHGPVDVPGSSFCTCNQVVLSFL